MGTTSVPDTERRLRREADPAQLRWIAQARSLAATLDMLAAPIVLLGPGEPERVWHANAAARHRLGDCAELCIRDGVLQGAPAIVDPLRRALQQARLLGPGQAQPFSFALGGQTAGGTMRVLDFGASADLPVSDLVLMELRPDTGPGHGLQRLCAEFGLTRKEAEVALGLYAMGSVDELARCSGRSIHTIRTQLKAAMQKTGRRTQAALVAAVADRLTADPRP